MQRLTHRIHEGLMPEQSGRRDTRSIDGDKEDRAPSASGPMQLGTDPGGKSLTPLMIRVLWAAASLAISIRVEEKNAVTLIHLQGVIPDAELVGKCQDDAGGSWQETRVVSSSCSAPEDMWLAPDRDLMG